MKYREFITALERGRIVSAYLFEGEEDYLKKEALERLKKKIILPDYEDFNYERFSAESSSVGQIVESLSTLPLKGKWRMVVVEEVDKLSEKNQKIVAEYLDNPVKTTCLVAIGGKIDKRKKLYKDFLKKGTIVSFYSLYDGEVVDWVKKRVEEEKKRISPPALFCIKERVGSNRRDLDNTMEKLLLYIHPRKVIEKEDVEEVLGEGAGGGVFDLTKAIRERNLAGALSILAKLLERGEAPLRIHSLVTREMRILLKIKEKGEKISSQEACTIIFGPRSYYAPFYTKIASDYTRAVRKLDFSDLITSYQYLVETEASIKTGREDPDLAIERMILHLLQPA
ncbi:MAG: DNA polymerase III subunit delta [Clostridia bacterium]|nr:DNA polymerase III subunit delta [Clostridia bacterium]